MESHHEKLCESKEHHEVSELLGLEEEMVIIWTREKSRKSVECGKM